MVNFQPPSASAWRALVGTTSLKRAMRDFISSWLGVQRSMAASLGFLRRLRRCARHDKYAAMMPPALHRRFIATAERLSAGLARDIAGIGPIWFPERADHGPAAFLVRSIVAQQISSSAARTIWGRVQAAALARGQSLADFLACVDAATLRACGLSGNKAKAVLAIQAAAMAAPFESLRALDHAQRTELLCAIWGIGQWTADMMAIFYYHEPDIWPEGDLAVMRGFKSYIGRKKPAKAALLFAPNRSLLALYMWRSKGGALPDK
jgi:DNA-3-methyladenine glycosylase II